MFTLSYKQVMGAWYDCLRVDTKYFFSILFGENKKYQGDAKKSLSFFL